MPDDWFAQHRYPGGPTGAFDEMAGAQQVPTGTNTGVTGGGLYGAGGYQPSAPYVPPPGGNTSGTATGAPSATGGGDYRSQFQQIVGSQPATPDTLNALEAQLKAAGFRVVRSADGTAGKIATPDGQIIDVIHGAHAGGGGAWQWLGPSGGGGTLGNMGGASGLPPGYWTGQQTGGGQYPLASAGGPGLAQPWTTPFEAPNVTDDRGFKFRMEQGQQALERAAAAKGTLLTGGMLKDLGEFSQGLASQEYDNAYGRKLGEYQMANQIYNQNNGNLFNRLSGLAGTGQTAVNQLGQSADSNITGAGNAQAAGTVGGANAWGQTLGNIGSSIPLWYQMSRGGMGSGYPGTPPYIPGAPVYGQNGQVPGWRT